MDKPAADSDAAAAASSEQDERATDDEQAPEEAAASATTANEQEVDSGQAPSLARSPLPSQFPDKVMMLLSKGTAPDALWWLPDAGNIRGAFAINRKVFTEKILDLAFNGNKWPSITRNLNRWGYKHVSYPSLPPHTTAYHNPLFQPNRPDLLKIMTQDKARARAAIHQLEMEELARNTSGTTTAPGAGAGIPPTKSPSVASASVPSGGLPTAPTRQQTILPGASAGGILTPSAPTTTAAATTTAHQTTLRDSLMLTGLPTAANQKQTTPTIPAVPPPLPAAAPTASTSRTSPTVGEKRKAQGDNEESPDTAAQSSSSSSSGFDLFPKEQLQAVLLPNMTPNLDSQTMLQSILSRQEGLDALVQQADLSATQPSQPPPQGLAVGLSPRLQDDVLLEQLQRQEILQQRRMEERQQLQLLLDLQSNNMQQQQHQQLQNRTSSTLLPAHLRLTPVQHQSLAQSLAQPQPQPQPQPAVQPPQPAQGQLQQLQQQQQQQLQLQFSPQLLQGAPLLQHQQPQLLGQSSSPPLSMEQQLLLNINAAAGATGSMAPMPAPATLATLSQQIQNPAAGSSNVPAHPVDAAQQQQAALIDELIRRQDEQRQRDPKEQSPQGRQEDCNPS